MGTSTERLGREVLSGEIAQAKGLKEPVMGRGEDKPGDTSERRWEWLSRGPGAEARVTGEQLRNSDFVLREMGSHCRV